MTDVDAATALAWVRSGEALLIDVRSAGEYAAGHAPQATHIPVSQLSPQALPAGAPGKLVLVCASGMRSSAGCGALRAKGLEAYSLKGGMSAWSRAGGPVEAAPGAAEAGMAQQKMMAGGAVLLGLALSALVHPGFLILTAAAGARLVSLLRPQAASACSSGGPGQTSCATPDARGKTSGCGNCGARQG